MVLGGQNQHQVARKEMENQPIPKEWTSYSVRARPLVWVSRAAKPTLLRQPWNKQSECPQKPVHPRVPRCGRVETSSPFGPCSNTHQVRGVA